MTERYDAVIVVLERNIRDDGAERLLAALRQLKGVLEVRPMVAAYGSQDERPVYVASLKFAADTDVPDEAEANGDFIALARNAFDVMVRRGWAAIQYVDRTWGVQDCRARFPEALGGRSWPDPFTALAEADRWYRENVESKP